METREHFLAVNGITLHVVETGNVHASPVVWLHGIWDRWLIWAEVAAQLDGRHFMMELRGHGESEKPEGAAQYRLADYVADIAGMLDLLDLIDVTVVGFSLGGLIAAVLAVREPGRVTRVVLVDPPYHDPAGPFSDLADMRDLHRQPVDEIATVLAFLRPDRTEAERQRGAQWLHLTADGPFDALIAGTYGPFALHDLLPAIRQPVLLMQADPQKGASLSDEMVTLARSLLPHAEHVRFPGSGHTIMHDRPDAFVTVVRGFFWRRGVG